MVDLGHGNLGHLPDQGNHTVHDSADGGKVVQRDQRVHLVLGRAQKSLDQVQANGLEDDSTNLVKKTDPDKLDFAKRGNDDTDNDGRNVHQKLHVGSSNAHRPRGEEHSDGGGSLEHLDERNTEVQVGQVAADQTQTEEQADRNDCAKVDAASHLDGLTAIKQRCVTSHELSCDGRKSQVVGRQNDGVACKRSSQYMWPIMWLRLELRFLRNSRVSRIHLLNRITEEERPIHVL